MAHDQPGRLSGILERIQDMQGLPQTGEMLLGPFRQKAGDAPCMAGALEQADAFTKTSSGKRIYAWRKETMERSFAEAKELHGLRYARMLGIRNMYEQSFLTAAVQNMKRIAKAFRFPFSLLILCIGDASERKQPLCRRSAPGFRQGQNVFWKNSVTGSNCNQYCNPCCSPCCRPCCAGIRRRCCTARRAGREAARKIHRTHFPRIPRRAGWGRSRRRG